MRESQIKKESQRYRLRANVKGFVSLWFYPSDEINSWIWLKNWISWNILKERKIIQRAKLLTFIAVLSWTVCNHVMVHWEGTGEETSWQIDLHSPDFPSYCLIWTKLYWQLVAVGIERQILLPRLTICFNSITPIPISSHQE